jgi:hypothetical protein
MKHVLSAMRSRLPARLSALIGCRRGASAVEFAILCPVFITFILGLFEVGWALYIQSAIEGALRLGARYGITGQGGTDTARKAAILARINDYTFGSVTVSEGDIDEKIYQSFNEVGLPEPWTDTNSNGLKDAGEWTDLNGNGQWDEDRGVSGVGGTGDIVRYEVRYTLQPLTGFVQAFVSGIPLKATTVVQNEPY